MTYGSLLNKKLKVGHYELMALKNREGIQYVRSVNSKVEVEMLIKGNDIYLIPYPPRRLPEKGLFKHVMIELERPLVLSGKGSFSLKTKIPVDMAIAVDEPIAKNIIDVFSLRVPKMAVYGGVQDGLVVRYLKATEGNEPDLAEIGIKIRNRTEDIVNLSRMVLNVDAFILCFLPGSWKIIGPEITVNIEGEKEALVEVSPPKCPKGYTKIFKEAQGRIIESPFKFSMKFGYSKRSWR